MREDIFKGRTFNDFLLEPQEGVVAHRQTVSLRSRFSQNIGLNLPIVAANMDTVTGPAMCIAVAQEGGIGVLPRSNSISIACQAGWVREVKRAENFIIENPYAIDENWPVGKARAEMKRKGVGTLLVINEREELTGMLTSGRIRLGGQDAESVRDWMIKLDELVFCQKPIASIAEALGELQRMHVEKLPLVDGKFKIKGLITAKDIASLTGHAQANKDDRGRLRVAAAIGATGDYLERAAELVGAGVDVLVMDIAHAHNGPVVKPAVEEFRRRFGGYELVVGNVATYAGAEFLRELGVQGIKAGIGSGYGCRTRLEAAVGVPQAQAIRAVWKAAQKEEDLPFISDGGVRVSGHVALALLLGASSVMLGSFLAGTDETPGEIITDPAMGTKYKIYRGMTSPEAKWGGVNAVAEIRNVEGQSRKIPYAGGSVKEILARIHDSLQSMVSYAGGHSLEEVRSKINPIPEDYLIPLSSAAIKESFVR